MIVWAFLGYYAAFVTFLLVAATDPAARDAFAIIMLAVIIPVTIIIASLAYWRGYRGHDNQQQPTPG
ncbi:MAG: hypothetical protein KDC39_15555 [Actinobacteria bacterium]|nr:hypothetical protein [Actinomycetota bacterium]